MKIEISIPEIANFIQSYCDISVDIKYVDTNKIEVNYVTTLGIHIQEVRDYSVLLGYELNWAANLLAKSGKLIIGKNLDKDVLQWNTSKKEILLNLMYGVPE